MPRSPRLQVAISKLGLVDMRLVGDEELDLVLKQTLADIDGELRLSQDGSLAGAIRQHFGAIVFQAQAVADAVKRLS